MRTLTASVDRLPEAVRNKATSGGAARWLKQLPALLAELERDWDIAVGPPFQHATEAFVAEAFVAGESMAGESMADGRVAVLKVLVPHNRNVVDEITTLGLDRGQGCVEMLRGDRQRGALLLERLGRPMVDLAMPLDRRLDILTSLAARVWRPAPGCGLRTGVDKGHRLIARIAELWESLDRPCTEAAVAQATGCAERRIAAHRAERAVLVHGDVHQWNALESGTGFKLVDPDGLLVEPEYDLGVLMREDPLELMAGDPRDRAARLAAGTGLDADAIWEWGVAERVATGLIATEIDLQPVGRQMLAAADDIARLVP